jgi:integrase
VKLGLIDHVERQRKANSTKLFPRIKPDSRGFLSGPMSHRFNQYLGTINVKEPGLVFHSFRHTFIDALRRADVTDVEMQTLVGHAPSGVTAGYGQLSDRQAYDRHRRLVDAVEYPGLDLSHLHAATD